MKFKFSLALTLFAISASLGADRWQVFSKPLPIYGAVPFGADGVMLATDGGVRYRSLNGDYVYHSNDGLEASSIHAVVGPFAISKEGIVAVLNGDALSWRVISRSYTSNKSNVVPGAVALENNILTIGFEDRLAFFDAPNSRSILTIDRIGANPLGVNSISKIVSHGDSLFVQLQKGTFVRKMDWSHLDSDIKLVDPDSWTELPSDRVVKGLEPWDSTKVVVDGKVLNDSALYDHIRKIREQMPYDSIFYDYSRIHQVVPVEKGHYLVGPEALFFYDGHQLKDLLESENEGAFNLNDAYEVHALPGGGVMAASTEGDIALNAGENWRDLYSAFVGSNTTSYSSRLKLLSVLPSGHVLFHVWGVSYYGFRDWGTVITFNSKVEPGNCLTSYDDVSNYSIAVSSIPAPDNSGYISVTGSYGGYGLVYITKEGETLCANQVGEAFIGAPFHAEIAEDGQWVVYVAARQGSDPTADGWLDILRFPPPKANGGELPSYIKPKSVKGLAQAPLDMVYEPIQKRLWMVSLSSLAYYDEGRDTLLMPAVLNGVHGVEYTSIDKDPHGGLWVGTAANGAYRITMKRESPDTLSAVNYSARNGMLSNGVNDLAVDQVGGRIWFAHDKGVSSLQRGELRDASPFMTDAKVEVKVYPNPFRPKVHSAFIMDNIAEDAVVSIYNRGGSLIRSFKGAEIIGGHLEWDGKDKGGRLVVPGVYYYVIKASSKTKKGKFIIAH